MLSKNHKLKVVLMSATINQDTFVRYFDRAPLIMIPGLTHPVEDLWVIQTYIHWCYSDAVIRI